jgi:hypothetical protein
MQSQNLDTMHSGVHVCPTAVKDETKLCVACGKPVLFKVTGRPPKYCTDCRVNSTSRVSLHRKMKRVEKDAKKNSLEALVDRVIDDVKMLTIDSIKDARFKFRNRFYPDTRHRPDHPAFNIPSRRFRRVPITARTIRGKVVVKGHELVRIPGSEEVRIPKYGRAAEGKAESSLATTPRKVTHQVDVNDREGVSGDGRYKAPTTTNMETPADRLVRVIFKK